MNYYTQQDLCEEFGISKRTMQYASKRFGIKPKRDRINGGHTCYSEEHYRVLKIYFYDIKLEVQLRIRALLIENYCGIKIRDVYRLLRNVGVDYTVVTKALLNLTINDTMVWEKWDEEYVPDDPKWLQTCETEEELQEKRDEREYMESTLCYGYAWWYDEHLEDEDDNHVLCVDFKEEDNYTLG